MKERKKMQKKREEIKNEQMVPLEKRDTSARETELEE